MKRSTLFASLLAASVISPAFAADLPVKAPLVAAPVVTNWTGFYLGVDGGYGWNVNTGSSFNTSPTGVIGGTGTAAATGATESPRGGFFGGTAGYNFQSGAFVWGLETDLQWSGIKGSGTAVVPCCAPPPFTAGNLALATSQNLTWFGTTRGRLGWLASPNLLLYATGGAFYGHEDVAATLSAPGPTFFGYPSAAGTTRLGWTAGAGFEYLFANNFSAKLEGLYYDMGSISSSFTCPATSTSCTAGFTNTATFNLRGGLIRAGLNWHFSPGPVIARY